MSKSAFKSGWLDESPAYPEEAPKFQWAQCVLSYIIAAFLFEAIAHSRPRTFTIVDDTSTSTTVVTES